LALAYLRTAAALGKLQVKRLGWVRHHVGDKLVRKMRDVAKDGFQRINGLVSAIIADRVPR
jgi:hypothetical protein